MLKVNRLTKKFNQNLAVKDVNFGINEGEIFALIGPNGSGKTTIIKMIAGLLQPSHGEILVGGMNVNKEPSKTKERIGYIPDEPSIWPSMTGEEYLRFTGALFGVPEDKLDNEISELLGVFSLEGIEKGYFEDYSRGNKQKFTILAALLHHPELLLIDEPIVGLDPTSAKIAKKRFQEFAQKGGSILVTTHTLPVAQEIANRIGLLKKSELIAIGTIEELRQKAGLASNANLEAVYQSLAE